MKNKLVAAALLVLVLAAGAALLPGLLDDGFPQGGGQPDLHAALAAQEAIKDSGLNYETYMWDTVLYVCVEDTDKAAWSRYETLMGDSIRAVTFWRPKSREELNALQQTVRALLGERLSDCRLDYYTCGLFLTVRHGTLEECRQLCASLPAGSQIAIQEIQRVEPA